MVKDSRECGSEWRVRTGGLRESTWSKGGLLCWGRISRLGTYMAGPEQGSKCSVCTGKGSSQLGVGDDGCCVLGKEGDSRSLRGRRLEERLLVFCFRETDRTMTDKKAEVEGLGWGPR